MKFKKLRLLGFKSFVDSSEFYIERGLTGIVGPNGCGKSNLIEAMRWVMGENSYKNMRASGMDDVIFSGSGNRPARNMAEVVLYLDNSDRDAPSAFNDGDEVQISRRIEREQGSAYRINGKDARAKDVQLLFADASTGARSPAMVGQGRIGELIQAKPQARRQLLEEAAGISGLYSRRHEAELRLRGAETNLERLDDVTMQLESQIENLKRQVRQANRFKTISSDIRCNEATLLHLRWHHAKLTQAQSQSELSQATKHVAEMASKQSEAARDQGVIAHELPDIRGKNAKVLAAHQHLQISRTQLEDEASRLEKRKTELEQYQAQLASDITREEQMITDNNAILTRLNDEEMALKDILANSDSHAIDLENAFDAASIKLAATEKLLSVTTSQRAEVAAQKMQIELKNQDLDERRKRLEKQLIEQREAVVEIAAEIARLPDINVKQNELEECKINVTKAEDSVSSCEVMLENMRADEDKVRQCVSDARREFDEIETEARTIKKILNANATLELFPPIVDKIKVQSGYEIALGAAIGDDLDLPLDASASAYWREINTIAHDGELPAGLTSLSEFVEAPKVLSRRLAQIGIVDEEVEGDHFHEALALGQCLVMRDGALWRWDGYKASADAPTSAALRLAQKNRLMELDVKAQQATRALREAEEKFVFTGSLVKSSQEELHEARENVRLENIAIGKARESLATAQEKSATLTNRSEILRQAESQLLEQLDDIKIELVEAKTALLTMPDLSQLERELSHVNTKIAIDRATAAQTRAAHESMARDNSNREQRLNVIHNERESWLVRGENADKQISALKERSDAVSLEAQQLADAPDNIAGKRLHLMNQLSESEALCKISADELALAETRNREVDKIAREAIANLSSARENRARVEERCIAAKERHEETELRIRQALNCEPHEAIKLAGIEGDEDKLDPDKIERSLERLKIERERLGAVNLRAEEEQRELSGQYDTIINERADVVEAIHKLRVGIQSLNKEGRTRLMSAFDTVNEQFTRLFTHLFGGGTAQLKLVESDDPLEAGLEILARPPGKKTQTMTLLSGGEQALTAMALIFAVFLTNPSPICVLDEVDAPLDDHNVERFCNLMDEMAVSTETRFVLITHNPITMARMNRLFGVTMAEQGVSQLVSVNLQTAEDMGDTG